MASRKSYVLCNRNGTHFFPGFACARSRLPGPAGPVRRPGGYFTAGQAAEAGWSKRALSYHVRTGLLVRVARGSYRLSGLPEPPFGDVVAAWPLVGPERAVVSHHTALEVLGLADTGACKVHLTVPREKRPRRRPALPWVAVHTASRPAGEGEVVRVGPLPVTSPAKAIVDVAEIGGCRGGVAPYRRCPADGSGNGGGRRPATGGGKPACLWRSSFRRAVEDRIDACEHCGIPHGHGAGNRRTRRHPGRGCPPVVRWRPGQGRLPAALPEVRCRLRRSRYVGFQGRLEPSLARGTCTHRSLRAELPQFSERGLWDRG